MGNYCSFSIAGNMRLRRPFSGRGPNALFVTYTSKREKGNFKREADTTPSIHQGTNMIDCTCCLCFNGERGTTARFRFTLASAKPLLTMHRASDTMPLNIKCIPFPTPLQDTDEPTVKRNVGESLTGKHFVKDNN